MGGAEATFSSESADPISGTNSARVDVTKVTDTVWHADLVTSFYARAGHDYRVSLKARATNPTHVYLMIQHSQPPYGGYYWFGPYEVGPTVSTISTTFHQPDDEYANFLVPLGESVTSIVFTADGPPVACPRMEVHRLHA